MLIPNLIPTRRRIRPSKTADTERVSTPIVCADKVQSRAVSDLIPYARNARRHSDKQIAKLAASIRLFGFLSPIIIDATGTVVAGHAANLETVSVAKNLPHRQSYKTEQWAYRATPQAHL